MNRNSIGFVKNSRLFGAAVLAFAAMAIVPSFLYAGTLTYTAEIPEMATNWSSEPLAIPQFDTNLGTLNSMTLTLDGSVSTVIQVIGFQKP